MRVVGVDGYRKGWIAVELERGLFAGASLHARFTDVLDRYRDARVIAVDIPIGIPDPGPREADLEARRFIGDRRSSVFLCPPRRVLESATHAEASALARQINGSGISQQAYGLRHRILEVDPIVEERVIEIHPEVSFRALAGRSLSRKKSWTGAMDRRALVEGAGILLPTELGEARAAPVDDVLDAAVAVWSGQRYLAGESRSLPGNPPMDKRGRRVAIWY